MCAQAVRSVFNIAIGADSADLQRTARSALLQMLNTVVKRITMATVVSVQPPAKRRVQEIGTENYNSACIGIWHRCNLVLLSWASL